MKVVTEEELESLRVQQASMPNRRNDAVRESLAFHQWLHSEAMLATEACRDRLRDLTGDAR
jgi:hypothetical protein